MNNTFTLEYVGCKTSRAENAQIYQHLVQKGFLFEKKNPSFVILNTCALTKASQEQTEDALKRLIEKYPQSKLIVYGCWVEAIVNNKIGAKSSMLNSQIFQNIDLIVSRFDTKKIVNYILAHYKKTGKPALRSCVNQRMAEKKSPVSTCLNVQFGCNRFCTYCIVPYLRERSRSLSFSQIIKNVNQLHKQGIKEIIIAGNDLSDFHWQSKKIEDLIAEILKKTNIERLRIDSLNVQAYTDRFIKHYSMLLKKYPTRLCCHFHIPIQSGSTSILKKMKRGYTFTQYENVVKKIRMAVPNANISTEVIIGFPGETKKYFNESVKNLKSLNFSHVLFVYYSSRIRTVAAQREDRANGWKKVTPREMLNRGELFMRHFFYNNIQFSKKFLNKNLLVLFEELSGNFFTGYSDNHIKVKVPNRGKNLIGKLAWVSIAKSEGSNLIGEVIAK